MIKALLLSLLLMGAPLAAFAQVTTLDVEAAVKLAIDHNVSLQAGRITLGKAARARDSAWNALLPSLDASVALSRSNELPPLAALSPWNLAVSLEATLPLSLSTVESVRGTVLAYEAGQLDFETARKQLERDVRKAFYSLLLSQESIRLAEQELATAEKTYQKALKGYQAGITPRLDALTARVTAENLKPALEEQRVAYASSLMSFQLLLGIERTAELTLNGAIEATAVHFDAEALISTYLDSRLDVLRLRKEVQVLESRKLLQERSAYTPSLSASASWAPGINDPFAFQWTTADQWADAGKLTLSLSIPLDSFIPGSTGSVAVASAQDDVAAAGLALQQARQKAAVEISSAVLSLEKSLRTMDVLELNVARAQEAYELTSTSYDSGTKGLLEVQVASDELQKARFLLLKERYGYLAGLIDLAYSLNTPFAELLVSPAP